MSWKPSPDFDAVTAELDALGNYAIEINSSSSSKR
jgi:hypothetical protein